MINSLKDLYSQRARSAPSAPFPDPTHRVIYNFDQGMPAPETFPLQRFELLAKEVLESEGIGACSYYAEPNDRAEMQYGYLGLRKEIVRWIDQRDGKALAPEQVILANGSAHGLSLIAAAFLDSNDGALVEAASFPYMVNYMQATGAKVLPVPVDSQGMVVEAVEAKLQALQDAGRRPKMIYTIPTFHVPTGTLMPLERRRQLVALAQKWNVLIVEDNCYYELWFEQPPPPTLFSLDDSGLVIQSDSFSKMLAPGVRTGWVAGAPVLIEALAKIRQDLGHGQLISRVLTHWMGQGLMKPHMDETRPKYRARRDLALNELRRHCEPMVRFDIPQGGIFFWLEIIRRMDYARVRAMLMEKGIACRPGEKFAIEEQSNSEHLRMSFLQVSDAELVRGVELLGQAMRECLI